MHRSDLIHARREQTACEVREDTTDGYVTSLPDWFDEAVVIWNEPEYSIEKRLEEVRSVADTLPDLVAFASRRHPNTLPRVRGAVESQAVRRSSARSPGAWRPA